MKSVLIIDDDELFGESLKENLSMNGLETNYIASPSELNNKVSYDIILVDLRLQNQSGLNILSELRSSWPQSFIIMMTGFGTIATAVEAIKLGANDYITKPVTYKKIMEVISKKSEELPEVEEQVMSLDRVEREYIEHILAKEKGNISKAAEKLGLHRQSLQRKLKKWVPNK